MNSRDLPRQEPVFRAAAWLYVLPRAAKVVLILTIAALAAFMVLAPLALKMLARLGA